MRVDGVYLPARRAFLRRGFRLGEEAAERIFERAEESNRAALADGSFQSARTVRQSALGRLSGSARRAATAQRDAEIANNP